MLFWSEIEREYEISISYPEALKSVAVVRW